MIDYTLRNSRIRAAAANPNIAVLLLDVVLGYGAQPQPDAELAPVIRAAKHAAEAEGRSLDVVCAVVGTDRDPQDRARVIAALQAAGAFVFTSNAAASTFAGHLCA